MPHLPIQSHFNQSGGFQGGPFLPHSSRPMSQYPDVAYYHGYGMVTPNAQSQYQQQAYIEWNNSMSNSSQNSNNEDDRETSKARASCNESDEEAAATALLMAGGRRSENVETMQAAVRKQKKYLMQRNSTKKNNDTKVENRGVEASITIVKNFPFILHHVLSKSEFAGTVLEWLSHGKSWRVLRWDELSDSVIPTYFPELCANRTVDKASLSSERMKLFLLQIKAWGFKEFKKVGPDLGSYQHEVCFIYKEFFIKIALTWFRHYSNSNLLYLLYFFQFFIKIAPNLCRHMKTVARGTKRPHEEDNVVSPPRRDHGHARQLSYDSTNSPMSKRVFLTEHREEMNGDVSSPGSRSGVRSVSFQDQGELTYSSPRSHAETQINYVSPASSKEAAIPPAPRLGVKSNRGGAKLTSKIINMDDQRAVSQWLPRISSRGSHPVSNRGRGAMNVSSRGRSVRGRSVKAASTRSHRVDDDPMILKKSDKLE